MTARLLSQSARGARQRSAIAAEIRKYRATVNNRHLESRLRELEGPAPAAMLAVIAFDWGLILVAWWTVAFLHLAFIPLALLVIGNRQRALGNLLHEGSHRLLCRGFRLNDRVCDFLLALPLFNVTSYYRKTHDQHHLYLGDTAADPDYIHRDSYRGAAWHRILAVNLFSWPMWTGNLLGNLPRLNRSDQARAVSWWLTLLGVLAAAAGPWPALIFAGLWLASRATVLHVLTTFREISDHAGLEPGALTSFTRNHPHEGVLRWLIHPHNNGYHITHHLLPRVCCWRLPAAHRLLLTLPEYAASHHCDGYFFGRHSALDCWSGRCRRQPAG